MQVVLLLALMLGADAGAVSRLDDKELANPEVRRRYDVNLKARDAIYDYKKGRADRKKVRRAVFANLSFSNLPMEGMVPATRDKLWDLITETATLAGAEGLLRPLTLQTLSQRRNAEIELAAFVDRLEELATTKTSNPEYAQELEDEYVLLINRLLGALLLQEVAGNKERKDWAIKLWKLYVPVHRELNPKIPRPYEALVAPIAEEKGLFY